MTRLLRSDLEAEAITQDSDAARIEADLKAGNLPEDQYAAAVRALVTPRRQAAVALRRAIVALQSIPPIGLGSRP